MNQIKKFSIKLISMLSAFIFSVTALSALPAVYAHAADKAHSVTVCIDPGHGGGNLGAQYAGQTEKNMTMAVANAMYSYLSKFEGIKICMTRTSDVDMSLEQRCDYAHAAGADFLFCIHFNASNDHSRYGCENWISAFGNNYAKGMTFANIEMGELTASGLLSRGIKTKMSKDGNADYYGMIRHCDDYGIPCDIIEHCHIDNANDMLHCSSNAKLAAFGVMDATAVAKYYGLKSAALGIDYSSYAKTVVKAPAVPVYPDTTAPDACSIALMSVDSAHIKAVFNVAAKDTQSRVLYYAYSIDGGKTFTAKQTWAGDNVNYVVPVSVTLNGASASNIQFAVWNNFDLGTVSNVINVK